MKPPPVLLSGLSRAAGAAAGAPAVEGASVTGPRRLSAEGGMAGVALGAAAAHRQVAAQPQSPALVESQSPLAAMLQPQRGLQCLGCLPTRPPATVARPAAALAQGAAASQDVAVVAAFGAAGTAPALQKERSASQPVD